MGATYDASKVRLEGHPIMGLGDEPPSDPLYVDRRQTVQALFAYHHGEKRDRRDGQTATVLGWLVLAMFSGMMVWALGVMMGWWTAG